jgi:hypothetical protein
MTRQLFAWIAVPAVVMTALLMAAPAGAQSRFRGFPPAVVGRGWGRPGANFVPGAWPYPWRGYYGWHHYRPWYRWGTYYPYYTYSPDSYDSYPSAPYPYDNAPFDGADPSGRTYLRAGSLAELWASGASYPPARSSSVPSEEGAPNTGEETSPR